MIQDVGFKVLHLGRFGRFGQKMGMIVNEFNINHRIG